MREQNAATSSVERRGDEYKRCRRVRWRSLRWRLRKGTASRLSFPPACPDRLVKPP
jgi:hypothetical protein